MDRRFATLVTGLALVAGSGCGPWYLVDSRVLSEDWKERVPEITSTQKGKAPHPLRLAILAPDECSNRNWSDKSGEAATTKLVLQNRCGVDMSELERAMVKRGLSVTSWKAVDQLVAAEHLSALQAAKKLGANAMVQVNSLEETIQKPLRDFQWRTEFHDSDRHGVEGPVVSVPERRAQALENGLHVVQALQFPTDRVGTSLNVTVVLVETSQAVWFYNWSHWHRVDGEFTTKQLFHCNRKHLDVCDPINLRWIQPGSRSGSEGNGVDGRAHENENEAAYHQASREAIENMVQTFAQWAD